MKKLFFLIGFVFLSNLFVNAQDDWTKVTSITSNGIRSVYFINASTGYAVGWGGTILKTINGGISWVTQTSGTDEVLLSSFFTDINTGYVVGDTGVIRKTVNGGTTWTVQTGGAGYNTFRSVLFTDANKGFIAGNQVFLKTINGGTTWTTQTIPPLNIMDCSFNSVFFTDADTGYAVGGKYGNPMVYGLIIKTTNGGSTWSADTIETNDLNSVYFTDAYTGYIVGRRDSNSVNGWIRIGVILKTTDGGTTWKTLTSKLNREYTSVFFTDSVTGFVSSGNGIESTTDGGKTWSEQTIGTYNPISSLFFADKKTGWAVGETGVYKYHPVPKNPEICMVLFDSITGKNKIVWEKPVVTDILRYKIYKEVKTNQYECFDSIPYSQLSMVVDSSSNPASYANKYKISLVDTSGAESKLSYFHKPLHIIVSSGNISWYSDNYIDESGVFSPDKYYVYRGRTQNNMICIDSIPGSVQSYSDTQYPGGTMYYQLGIPMPSCEPIGLLKAGAGLYSQSFSNVIVINHSSINHLSQNDVAVFPNPTPGIVNLVGDNILSSELFDITGKSYGLHYSKLIDISSLPAGTYILNIYGKEGLIKKEKIIKK